MQIVQQDDGMVDPGIARPIQQGDAMAPRFVHDPVELGRSRSEFGGIAPAEDVETFGPMFEPLSKLVAWGQLFEPPVEPSSGFGDAPGPKAIDQVPPTVTAVGGLVDALQGYRHGSSRIAWLNRS